MPISFHSEDVSFLPKQRRALRHWIEHCIVSEGCTAGDIAYIFCSDEHLLEMNREHLKHDYYTDIITFDYSDGKRLSGDLFISIDRIRDNAKTLRISFPDELHRVMIHGVLHLAGHGDKTKADAANMRILEESCLTLRHF
jgi:rRNA maturation RNase YbeY